MKVNVFFIWTISFLFLCQIGYTQKVLLLQKPGKTKRFLYHTGDNITIRSGGPEFIESGEITYIDDSICIVNKNYTFQLSKINEVQITRHFINGSWRMMFLASAVYAGGSMFNRAINNDKPLIDNTILPVSGSFVVLGTAAFLFRYRHCKMEDGWRLKVLDFNIFKERTERKE